MQIKSADMLKFIELMKSKPAETQLRMMWLLISALLANVEQLEAYRNADFEMFQRHAETYDRVTAKILADHTTLDVQLTAIFEELAKELAP